MLKLLTSVQTSNQYMGGYRPCESSRSDCLIYVKSGNIIRKSGKLSTNKNNKKKNETFT